MATSLNTKMPMGESSRDSARQFNSMDIAIDIDNESPQESELTPEQRHQMEAERRVEALKRCLGGWRVAGGVLGIMMVIGWICIITVLILEEKWQLVLIAWLLLYAAGHFCYWYFKRHHIISMNAQMRARLNRLGNGEKPNDKPPTYDEVIKSEPPPPEYYSVVEENPTNFDKIRNALRATGAIPKVFKFGSRTKTNKHSEQLPSESSDSSLYIIEENYNSHRNSPSHSSTSVSSVFPSGNIFSETSRVTVLPGELRSDIDSDVLPPSYDSIIFSTETTPVDTTQTQSRRLSTIAVDITEQH